MSGFSSFAPHLGAALGAGLMVAAAAAFNAGAGASVGDAASARNAASGPEAAAIAAPRDVRNAEFAAPQSAASLATQARRDAPGDVTAGPAAGEGRPRLAVILDDVADMDAARRALALPAPVTIAVLPYAEEAPQIAALVTGAGAELFVHLPMEPIGLDDPGPYALTKQLNADDLAVRLAYAFARTPGAAGFNNHMGSRMTSDRASMEAVFAAIKDPAVRGVAHNPIFVDSLTHPRSQAAAAAEAAGFAALKRDVFLDHVRDPVAIEAQLQAAIQLAAARGSAVAIAHPHPETFAVLETLAERARAAGVDVVPVSALAQR